MTNISTNTLANDIARCNGSGNDTEGWREAEVERLRNELEVRIFAFSILLIATLAVSVGNLLTLILKK